MLAPGSLPKAPGKRLLLLAPWLEPGGADRCNLDLLRALAREGWMLTVVASLAAEHRWRDRFTALTADVWVLPDFLSAEKACGFLAYLVDSRQPDLMLLSNSAFAYDVLGYVRTRYPGLPVVDLNHMEEGWDDGGHPVEPLDALPCWTGTGSYPGTCATGCSTVASRRARSRCCTGSPMWTRGNPTA